MHEQDIDEMVHAALSTPTGRILHQWLVNNYLMSVKSTTDPNHALFMNGQQSLVISLNTRYARHIERQENADVSDSRDHRRRQRPGSRPRGEISV